MSLLFDEGCFRSRLLTISMLLVSGFRKGQRRHRHSKPTEILSMTCAPDDIVGRGGNSDTYQQQREPIYESRQACTVCSREMTSLSNCDYAYMWDSPNSKPRRLKYDKLYSAGIYGPLNCKCVPVKLQELDIRDSQCPPTMTTSDNIRDPGSSHVTFCELDPDVVRTLDRTYRNDLQFGTEMRTLGTFKDDVSNRNDKESTDNFHFSA